MPARLTCLKKNKQLLELFGLYDKLAGAWVNSAADLTATLKDSAGAPVTGFTAIALAYIAGSNGDYRGSVAASVDPAPGTGYVLHVESDPNVSGINFQEPTTVKARTTE